VYVGKLAVNKGVGKLLPALDRARIGWPLVVIGSGPERRAVEEAFRLAGREVRMLGWLPREEALAWMAHAAILAFPSHGPESLSRVLLEASALGVAIAAMDTGGTADIVLTGRTGLLSTTVEGFGDDLARLAGDPDLRAELGRAARARIDERFDASVVVTRIEKLYRDLIDRGRS
jgi:glycosyltransferase involved in cell wall biosynthesis